MSEQNPPGGPDRPDTSSGRPEYPPQPGPYPPPPTGQAPYGQAGGSPYGQGQPSPYAQPPAPYGAPGYGPGYGPVRNPDERPGRLLAAAIITWIFAGLALLGALAMLVGGLAGNDSFYDRAIDEAGGAGVVTAEEMRAGIVAVGVILGVWSLAAIVLAFLMLRRQNWARITLAVSAAMTALFSLLAITSGVSVLTLAAAVVVLILLFGRDSGDWFARRGHAAAGMPGYPSPYPHEQSQQPAYPPPPTGQSWTAPGEQVDKPSDGPQQPDQPGDNPRPPSGGW
jgi:hypothetical protein